MDVQHGEHVFPFKFKMETSNCGRLSDAITCLQQTLVEGNKSSNVDIELMLENIHCCESIVKELNESEEDAFYKTAFSSLQSSLASHATILTAKIQNLNPDLCCYISSPPLQSTELLSPTSNVETRAPLFKDRNTDSAYCRNEYDTENELTNAEDNQARARKDAIESTILSGGNVRFDDVVGLVESKQSLYDAIIMPLMFPHLFSGGRRPWQRILLFGPPGTGKSRLARAVATEVKATFYCVSSTDLMSSWVGESEKLIKELFHHANSQQNRAIIFIDEIDSLCRHRSSREDESTRRIKTELLIQMDGAEQSLNPKILLLCATNCPWDLDTAFLRRFQKRIYISLPDHQSRIAMLKLYCKGSRVDLTVDEWNTLATQTDGYSGSDLSTLAMGALLLPIRDLQTAKLWDITPDGKWRPSRDPRIGIKAKMSEIPPDKVCEREVTLQDFLNCLTSHRSTVTKYELDLFDKFTTSFGQIG